jgi:hypothetical protein
MSDALIGKTKSEVEDLLGPPALTTAWDSAAPPQGLSGAELDAWKEAELHDIWVYSGKVLSFNMKGVVKRVGTDTRRYLPPAIS